MLHDHRDEWDLLDLTDFDEASVTVRVLQGLFAEQGFLVRLSDRFICPHQALDPSEGFDGFLAKTARKDNYLRRRKWLEKQPGYRVEKTTAPDSLAAPLTDFFRLHAMRWEGDGGSQGIKGAGVEAFHRDATALLAEQGWLRMYTLKLGDEALASVYGVVHRGKFTYFQSGYDPAWRSKSVGLVLVGETFKDSFAEGLTEYDFLRGTETYKADWVGSSRRTVALRIHAMKGRGAWLSRHETLARHLRDALKRALPTGWVERIRHRRRRSAAI
jgi:CelD/BcsL family acetyltransferase involved in cellulose biosynthesis